MHNVVPLTTRVPQHVARAITLRHQANALVHALLKGRPDTVTATQRSPAVTAILLIRAIRNADLSIVLILGFEAFGLPLFEGFRTLADMGVDAMLPDAETVLVRSLAGQANDMAFNVA